MSSERRCSVDVSVGGQELSALGSGTVQFDLGTGPEPPPLPPNISQNVLILYGGISSYRTPSP